MHITLSFDDAPAAEPVPATKSFGLNKIARKPEFGKFIRNGNTFSPVQANTELWKRLPAGCYSGGIDRSGRPFLECKDVRSDDLLKFKDSRYNSVTAEISKFWTLGQHFKDMGFTHKRGVLMWGAPGGGKSSIIKQVMCESCSSNNIVIFPTDVYDLPRIFSAVRDVEPTRNMLVVLEDIDNLPERPILSMFDGDDQMDGVCFLASTNYPERLPPRIMRSGRFDTKIEIKNPPREGRVAYLQAKVKGVATAEQIEQMADLTEDFTFAQMREFVVGCFGFGHPIKEEATRIRRNFTESSADKRKSGRPAWSIRGDTSHVRKIVAEVRRPLTSRPVAK